jgi:hypothetical protein
VNAIGEAFHVRVLPGATLRAPTSVDARELSARVIIDIPPKMITASQGVPPSTSTGIARSTR